MAVTAPKCSICGKKHWSREPHDWGNAPLLDPSIPKSVHKPVEKRVHKSEKKEEVYTMRRIGIRELRANLARELSNLPFEIEKNGIVIAVVKGKK